ncbi:hypothetical protein, variant 1 [Aphanomyces astaci]|uniref:Protein kinase domain-containing protein n=1 Tax=Aphanomyces astaci TaxID=112090 RepID=W4FNN2_APHAT|nr:hypothetical protein, variant 1 [Aphanomyces astaci]ETV69055.1 hypothetical protein, variant 1 [Aphanomyces astaci]|eukprot:XP_009841515.1 hypothetical protein, variant 1 [Aphanomyces astaci]
MATSNTYKASQYGDGTTSSTGIASASRLYTSPVKSSNAHDGSNHSAAVYTSPLTTLASGAPRRSSSLTSSPLLATASDLTSTAAPFVPQQLQRPAPSSADPSESAPLVQVTRGGCIFFVPEADATGVPPPPIPPSTLLPPSPSYEHPPHLHVDTHGDHLHYPSHYSPHVGHPPHSAPYPSSPIVATRRSLASLALAPSIRRSLDAQHDEMVRQVDPGDERYKEIPSQFVCMWPLDTTTSQHRNVAGSFGYPSHSYKVLSDTDGRTYALRRIENARTTPTIVQQAVDMWKRVQHAAMVPLHRGFVSHGALFFLCEYYPGAVSLHQKYIQQQHPPSEAFLWSVLTQVCGALRVVHGASLACKSIHAKRLLITSHDRIRITGLGVLDVLEYDSLKSKPRVDGMQREDILALGKVVLSVASGRDWHMSIHQEMVEVMESRYSPTLCALVTSLLDQSIDTVAALSMPLQDSVFAALDAQSRVADESELQLGAEYQNGRMLLLLMKLGLVNERPELLQDQSWADTGDRYLLQLFRDYVFHQVDELNRPVVDFGHVVDCLNKLDSAAPEKILLSSRDGQSVLVVSYAEVHRCVQQTFTELLTAAQRRPSYATPAAKPVTQPTRGGAHRSIPRGSGRGGGGRNGRDY